MCNVTPSWPVVCACIIMYKEEYSVQKAGKQKDNELSPENIAMTVK